MTFIFRYVAFCHYCYWKTKNNKTDFEKIVICNDSLAALIFIVVVVCFAFLFTTFDSVPEFRFGIRVGEDGLCITVVTAIVLQIVFSAGKVKEAAAALVCFLFLL